MLPWEFTAVKELGRQIEYQLDSGGEVELSSSSLSDQPTVAAINPEEASPETLVVANGPEKEASEPSIEMTEELPGKASGPEKEPFESLTEAPEEPIPEEAR